VGQVQVERVSAGARRVGRRVVETGQHAGRHACTISAMTAAARRVAAEEAWRALRPQLAAEAEAALGGEADAFLTRAELALFDVHEPLAVLYGAVADALFARALRIVLAAAAQRPAALRRLDRRSELDPGRFQRTRKQ